MVSILTVLITWYVVYNAKSQLHPEHNILNLDIVTHVLPRIRNLRIPRSLPRLTPRAHAASPLRSHLGHVQIQQQSRLARRRQPALHMELWRRNGLREPC